MQQMNAFDSGMTLVQARDTMNMLIQQGGTTAHKIGTLYNHVVGRKLAELAGFRSAQEFFNTEVRGISQTTLSLYGAVARSFTEAVCTQYGAYRLRALMRYAEAAGLVLELDPGMMMIEVPGEDATVMAKPFQVCSVDDVDRATRAKKTPAPVRVPVPDRARLLFFEDSLFRSFSGVAEVRISTNSQDGKTFLNLQGVPMSEVPRLIQALQQGLEAQPSLATPPQLHAIA
ncbi:hypothetical protein [Archangium sp.]|uniref:hypothetical protein n=1 Tax=Archangium sp. TaxID=1872627 RepID=UPI00286BB95E|nr:hypothetical protein [Archangium sp.]